MKALCVTVAVTMTGLLAGCPSPPHSPPDACVPSGRPGQRTGQTAVYAPSRQQLILFGGESALPDPHGQIPPADLNEVWTYRASCPGWTQIRSRFSPAPRIGQAAAYDSTRDRLLIVGGLADGPTLLMDVWALDLSDLTWTALNPGGTAPAPRQGHRAGYDPGRDRLLLFGGNTGPVFGDGPAADTYQLLFTAGTQGGNGTWSQLSGPAPAARQDHAAALDTRRSQWLIFGGAFDHSNYSNELWAFDLRLSTWQIVTSLGDAPAARYDAEIAYEATSDRVLLFGGLDAGEFGPRNDTWAFAYGTGTAGTWSQLIAGDTNLGPDGVDHHSPERRSGHAAALGGGQLLVFGGQSQCGLLDDLWTLDLGLGTWSSPSPPQTGQTCARRATQGQICPNDCAAPQAP